MSPSRQASSGRKAYELIQTLYPICRSITGDGNRRTLRILQEYVPLEIHEVPTGTVVYDWTVPREWNLRDAYIKNSAGEKIIDIQTSNLHVVNYSVAVKKKLSLSALKPHLYTLPEHPEWIPYVTSYYQDNWGFCLPYRHYQSLPDDTYEVCIDSTLTDGSLSYGEYVVPGQTTDEVLISTYICHPSLCNDNLSGVAITTLLAQWLKKRTPRYTYRFLFIPETIGSLVWLSTQQPVIPRIKFGLVATCLGDKGQLTYKQSPGPQSLINRVVETVLRDSGNPYRVMPFTPAKGSDERQFCSPGFQLPVGSLMRTPYTEFPQYHTSADDLSFVDPLSLGDSLKTYQEVIEVIEKNNSYLNTQPFGEPQLGKYGLYHALGAKPQVEEQRQALLWVLHLSEGTQSLLDIAQRSGISFSVIYDAAQALEDKKLLRPVSP